jgi:hypothetical protein
MTTSTGYRKPVSVLEAAGSGLEGLEKQLLAFQYVLVIVDAEEDSALGFGINRWDHGSPSRTIFNIPTQETVQNCSIFSEFFLRDAPSRWVVGAKMRCKIAVELQLKVANNFVKDVPVGAPEACPPHWGQAKPRKRCSSIQTSFDSWRIGWEPVDINRRARTRFAA